MRDERTDHTIDQLEQDLHRSQFTRWEAETFLAERHRKKFESLANAEGKWARRWEVAKEISELVFAFIGKIALAALIGIGLLSS